MKPYKTCATVLRMNQKNGDKGLFTQLKCNSFHLTCLLLYKKSRLQVLNYFTCFKNVMKKSIL